MCAMSEDNPKSLWLKVEVETTDTAEIKYPSSLIDSRATGEFIDQQYVKSCRLQTRKLSRLIPVHNIDGTLNEAGSITEVVDLILWYKGHLERTLFTVTSLGKEKHILRHSWLRKHNPEVNWATGEVKMFRCPHIVAQVVGKKSGKNGSFARLRPDGKEPALPDQCWNSSPTWMKRTVRIQTVWS